MQCNMSLASVVVVIIFVGFVHGHDVYYEKCPEFRPMKDFQWDKFKDGRWFATEQFDTTGIKCFTYDFYNDRDGIRILEQNGVQTTADALNIDNHITYRGRISAPSRANPASMIVRFTLNPLGTSSFIVMDTDYDTYALVCSCQQIVDFYFIKYHRRSCSILQRDNQRDEAIAERLHALLNTLVVTSGEGTSHDFDIIDHSDCDYSPAKDGVNLDVEKFLGVELGLSEFE